MGSESPLGVRQPSGAPFGALAGTGLFVVVAAAGFTWAKWWPYAHKLAGLWSSRAWSGTSIFDAAGAAGSAPSWHGAWSFTVAYGKSIWIALVAGLVVAAAVESLLPRARLARILGPGGRLGGSLAGGLLALPCMMCTCCGAPVAVSMRRGGASRSAALAYWVGNPTLNPAVLAFLALVAPWQWVATRLVIGVVLVFVLTRLVDRSAGAPVPADVIPPQAAEPTPEPAFDLAGAPRRFVRALVRLCVTLLPEYLVVVVMLGLLRGWLFPFGADAAHWGIAAVLLAAVVGTLMVIPTAGEIPILLGLAAVGVGSGVLGTLLIVLPAVSLPSMTMVARTMSVRVTVATATAVAAAGLLGGALLWVLRA